MPFKFYIQDLYDRTEVTEPRGWNGIMSALKRDFAVHGVFFKYTDGSIKLGFGCDGKILLEAAYQKDGAEAFYMFEVDEADNALTTFTTIFSGEFDFSTRKFPEDYFNIDVSEINEIDKIKNRASLKTGLNKQLTFDGITVSKINSSKIVNLATKPLAELIVENTGETITQQSVAATSSTEMFGQLHFDLIENLEIEAFTNSNSEWLTNDTDTFLRLSKLGGLHWIFDVDYDLDLTEDQGSGTTTYSTELRINFDKPPIAGSFGAARQYLLDSGGTIGPSPHDESQTVTLTNDSNFNNFNGGTGFTLKLFVKMTSTGTSQFTAIWTVRQFRIRIIDLAANLGTTAIWYHPFDSLNKTLNFITGQYDYLYSQLLGDQERGYTLDGCFSQMRLTNGFRIRQIEDDDKAPIASFKDYINNFNVIGAIGYGIESLESPDFIPGSFAISWGEEYANIAEIIIIAENLIYDIAVGDKIGFYNGETLYGTYEVLTVEYRGVIVFNTHIDIDVSNNPDLFLSSGFDANIFITSDATTSFRDRLRVEKWEHFYGDNELIDLGVVQEYSEEPFDDVLYNEIGISFKKFANDEDKPTTLEDFETKSSWALPVTKSKKLLNLSMDWIMSTFMINESRNTLFAEKPTTSHKLDDNIFLCDIVPLEIDTTVTFVHNASDLDTIEVSADVYENYIRGISGFTIIGATLNADASYLFNKNLVEHLLPTDTYKIFLGLQTVVTDPDDPVTVIGQVSFALNGYKAESNEKITSSSGLTGTVYTYNQRRTMKRFLIRWGRYVSSILAYLVDSANVTIQNLFYINNGDFSSEIDTSQLTDDCLMGDNSGALIREADNINSFALGTAKFKPNLINGTVKICDEDFDRIKDAHKNSLLYAYFDGSIYGISAIDKENLNFIHKTGIFDITINASFDNGSETIKSDILLSTTDFISGGFILYYANSIPGNIGEIQIYIYGDSLQLFKSDNLNSILEDGELHEINLVGNGTTIILKIDNQTYSISGTIDPGGGDSDTDLFVAAGGGVVIYNHHVGGISQIKIKNGSILVAQYLFNIMDTIIPNSGIYIGHLTLSSLPSYLNTHGYGYLTMTSPRGKTTSGWLMEIKRNPVDRIAKVKLLERNGSSEPARLLESGDFRLLESGDFRLLE